MTETIFTPLAPSGFRRTPWKNGGGVTLDIADAYRPGTAPGSWEGMIWRFGRTGIAAPGPFSDLTGYERLQAVVAGSGLVLDTPDGEIDLRRPFAPVRYDGAMPIISRLENGPVEVVNLIAERASTAIEMVSLGPGDSATMGEGIGIVYAPAEAVSGRCDERAFAVAAGHALRIDPERACSLSIDAGRALLATIRVR